MKLIRREGRAVRVVTDAWVTVADDEEVPAAIDVIVSFERWRAERDALRSRGDGRVGIRVGGDEPPERVAAELEGAALVAVDFAKFTDGRGYSLARLLRSRYGYRGELRAVGQVLRDQLFYLARCGFDAFVLSGGADPGEALSAFGDLSVTYQPAADHDEPIWHRRG